MSLVQKYCALVLIVVAASVLVENRSYNNGLIFYDLKTKQAYLPPTVSVSRGRGLANIKFSDKGSIWSTFGKPCDCAGPLCGCCVGIKVKQYNFDQKMCANVSYVQRKEEINMEVFLNEKQSAKYAVSARNPSPFCIPVMVGIPMSMCVQMSNVGLQGDNMNACMDFMVQLASTQLFEMHFQCMQMGTQGVQWLQPGGSPVIPPSESKITDRSDNVADEYYDEEEQNEIETGVEQGNDNAVNDRPEPDENKAEEEVDYNDIMETASENNTEGDEEETKDNEVILSHEKQEQIDTELLKESMETDKVTLLNDDEQPVNEESSDVASFVGLNNTGEISTEAHNNESDFNKSMETTGEPMETVTVTYKQNQHVIMATVKPLTMPTAAVESNDIDNIDTAVTTAAIMTTTMKAATGKTPTLTAPKTTEATPTATTAAPATATTFIVNNDSDNSQDNDSDYGDEESDEDDEGADEEEEGGEDGEEVDEEVEDADELNERQKEKEQIPQTTENASVANDDSSSTDRHEEEDEGEYDNSETEEDEDEEDEDYEETETPATTNTTESQPINNGLITASTASTPDDFVEQTDEYTDITSNNPQLSSTDVELSNADSTSSSGGGASNSNSASVEWPTVGNIVNMSQITDTATPLTRASKLLTLRKPHHPQRQQQWHYPQHQLHQRHARRQRNNHRHHVA